MDALPPLHEVGQVFSCCELCVENKRCHLIIPVVTFVLMTFDMITDWINWIEWYGIGGYDQYFFASMFETSISVRGCSWDRHCGSWKYSLLLRSWLTLGVNVLEEKFPQIIEISMNIYPSRKCRTYYKPEVRTGLDSEDRT